MTEKKYSRHLALEIWERVKDGTFDQWEKQNLRRIERFPWPTRAILPVGELAKGHANIIEILGPSESGKSTIIEHLRENPDPRTRTTVLGEFDLADPATGRPFGINIRETAKSVMGGLGIERAHTLLEYTKLAVFERAVETNMRLMREEAEKRKRGKPILTFVERGPNDVLASSHWVNQMAQHKTELSPKLREYIYDNQISIDTERSVYPGFNDEVINLFFYSLALIPFVDALVLVKISKKASRTRRIDRGAAADGPVVNRWTRPYIEKAYGWLLGSIYPLLRNRYGTGLLVVDGERPIKENRQKVLDFSLQVAKVA